MDKDQQEKTESPEIMDAEKLNEMIRETVREILPEFLSQDTEDEETEEEILTTSSTPKKGADIQEEVKRQVEEAMRTLQAAKPKTVKKVVRQAQPKAEIEEAPEAPKKKFDLSKLLWDN